MHHGPGSHERPGNATAPSDDESYLERPDPYSPAMMIKHSFFLLSILLLLAPSVDAQEDTIRIQTLSFDSITTRRGWWSFPDDQQTYRKVLMHHTLKCSPLTTQDQFACGEWDYLTYSYVYDHTGVLDSNALTHPWFLVGTDAPTSLELVEQPLIDVQQALLSGSVVTSTVSEDLYTLGIGDATDTGMLSTASGVSRSQYLFTADELMASGLVAGPIQQIRFTTDNAGNGPVQRLTVRMKLTNASAIVSFDELDLQLVYDMVPDGMGIIPGEHVLQLNTDLVWDGTSNLLLDISSETDMGAMGAGVTATSSAEGSAIQDTAKDGFLGLMNGYVAVDPQAFNTLGDEITITFKVKGDASLPLNTSILEARDAQDLRILNVHLPWSNSRVYWDAGNDGTGYDRIDKDALPNELEEQWNHWAFVKNSSTGIMRIYLNGVLWHSGTGMTRPMTGITSFRIGSGTTGAYPYPGMVDEFNVFAATLDAATIQEWVDRKVDGTHPFSGALLYSFHFDEDLDEFAVINDADPATGGILMGTVQRHRYPASDLGASSTGITVRPDLTFGAGQYVTEEVTGVIGIPTVRPGIAQQFFEVQGNAVASVDTVFGWMAGMQYTYAPDGSAVDSMEVAGVVTENDTLEYFGVPFEVIDRYEIGRFITPYGIGLSLGNNGFRWTYDVTDYQWLLHDSVDFSAGNQQELIDVTFEMIEGTPPRSLVNMQRPWGPQRSYSYASLSDDSQLAAVTLDLHPSAAQWSLGTRFTGHGHASNSGNYPHCCEWKDNTHTLIANGTLADEWHIWQTNECALNPVYPQGGTWLGSREGWCPGDLVKDHVVELTSHVTGNSVTLDYAITPVPANNLGMGSGNYVVNMDLFEYGPPSFELDAEILEVKRPSAADYFRRDNPICYDPVVVLRNAGGQDLTSVTFNYSVSGGTMLTHTWSGILKHMEIAEVVLPIDDGSFWDGDDDNLFQVSTSAPNGGTDQHIANDGYTAGFELPVVYTDNIILDYRTNNRPLENTVTIRDVYGNIKFQRNVHTANTVYRDTTDLAAGCYTLEIMDTGNDGLSYWADTQQGSGYFRLRRLTNTVLKTFQSEFGRSINWAFVIGDFVGMEEPSNESRVIAYPNPGTGTYTLQMTGLTGRSMIHISDASGRVVQESNLELHGDDRIQLDLEGEADGLYIVRVIAEAGTVSTRLMKQ